MAATALLATLFALLVQTSPQPQQPEQPQVPPAAGQAPLDKLPPRQRRDELEPADRPSPSQDRAWIGVTLQAEPAQPDGSERPGLSVVQVLPGSPAERAGLEGGDRLIAAEDRPLASYDELARLLREHVPGNRLRLLVEREVNVVPERGDSGRPRLGVHLQPGEPGRGVGIGEVVAGSPAARAGLRERDRILAVGGREVSAPQEVVDALEAQSSSRTIDVAFARELEVTLGSMPESLSGRPEEGAFEIPRLAPRGQPDWPLGRVPGMAPGDLGDLEELKSELRALSEEVRSLRALIEELRAEVAKLRR
jgi:membrane-associated protease RseP (regulator of RpoE activity)